MRRGWLLMLATAGCGRFGFDPGDVDAAVDAAVAVDALVMFDAEVSGACGGTALYADPFSDDVPGPIFEPVGQADVAPTESGGEMIVTIGVVAANHYGAYRTVASYPSDGLCAVVEVTSLPTAPAAAYFKLTEGQLVVEFYALGGVDGHIEMRTQDSKNVGNYHEEPYDPIAMRFWRFRQAGDLTRWDTSPDGVRYVERKRLAGFFPSADCRIELGGGTDIAVSGAGDARFTATAASGP